MAKHNEAECPKCGGKNVFRIPGTRFGTEYGLCRLCSHKAHYEDFTDTYEASQSCGGREFDKDRYYQWKSINP